MTFKAGIDIPLSKLSVKPTCNNFLYPGTHVVIAYSYIDSLVEGSDTRTFLPRAEILLTKPVFFTFFNQSISPCFVLQPFLKVSFILVFLFTISQLLSARSHPDPDSLTDVPSPGFGSDEDSRLFQLPTPPMTKIHGVRSIDRDGGGGGVTSAAAEEGGGKKAVAPAVASKTGITPSNEKA